MSCNIDEILVEINFWFSIYMFNDLNFYNNSIECVFLFICSVLRQFKLILNLLHKNSQLIPLLRACKEKIYFVENSTCISIFSSFFIWKILIGKLLFSKRSHISRHHELIFWRFLGVLVGVQKIGGGGGLNY